MAFLFLVFALASTTQALLVPQEEGIGAGKLCPDGFSSCPDTSTCCQLADKRWACCPMSEAVCCADHTHCCPHETVCNLAQQTCERQQQVIALGVKVPAEPLGIVVCPDKKSSCPTGTSCCQQASGYACCPLPNAVCCSDQVHCCPHATACDLAHGRCTRQNFTTELLLTLPASKTQLASNNNKHTCPGGQFSCADSSTCCRIPSGSWGCCPYRNADCCSDGIHCCPSGMECDVASSRCRQAGTRLRADASPAARIGDLVGAF